MNWEQLLSLKKHGDTTKRLRIDEDETRIGFEVDFDRIIFSSEFRILQDKTQVVPLSKTDFVHTRLTHSLEVSVVGRSLGRAVGKFILEKYPHLKEVYGYKINDFGAIVAAACLAHDIGNPPFGHSGEKAIGEFFSLGNGQKFKDELNAKQWQDIVDFEGNANGFSILTSNRPGVEGGIRLTYATLGAFMKYPKESLPKKPSTQIEDKKYGFFQKDKDFFVEVANELGLVSKNKEDIGYYRHPLCFLVEAADDICYTIIDFEDGIKKGLIHEDFALEYLIKLVQPSINKQKYAQLTTKEDRISYLRALSIGNLISDAVRLFKTHESEILEGKFHVSLMDKSQFKAQIDDIINISIKNIYQSKEVVEKEITGYKVIHSILDAFVNAFVNSKNGSVSNFDKLILKLLPEQFHIDTDDQYLQLLNICQFVSLLTDGKAIEIYGIISAGKVG